MQRTGFSVRLAVMVMGLAAMPAPAFSQDQAALTVLPSDIADYRCLTALHMRQNAVLGNGAMGEHEQVEAVNNLIIISAFFAGRLTHYSTEEAASNFARAQQELAEATPEEADAVVQSCANFYLSVMDLLASIQQGQQ